MNLAVVRGTVVSTVKDERLSGRRLLLIQPVAFDGTPQGEWLVATDTVRAGVSETVVYVRGKEAAFAHRPDTVVSDVAVVGIVERHHLPPGHRTGGSTGASS